MKMRNKMPQETSGAKTLTSVYTIEIISVAKLLLYFGNSHNHPRDEKSFTEKSLRNFDFLMK